MSLGWLLAVDFGTSNTAAAHVDLDRGVVQTLPLSHHGNLMPSAVFVESPHSIVVGDVALNRAQMNPAAFVPAPKRLVGQGMVRVNNFDLPDSVLVAAVLRAVVDRAVAVHNGHPPQGVVLTHPEAWSPAEVQVLFDAAALAGFDRSRTQMVSEPRAAAHFYTRTKAIPVGGRIAVFDFGGGTLDIAVLAATQGHTFTVIAAGGDNSLGGKNLDAAIRRWVDHQLQEGDPRLLAFLRTAVAAPGTVTDVQGAIRAQRSLDDSIRGAKELLSEAPSATIDVIGNGIQETLSLTRGEFEAVIGEQIERGVELTRRVLGDAGLTRSTDLHALYLTGGSSRIPLVHEQLQVMGPVARLDDPKTVVVRGALDAVGASAGATRAPAFTGPIPTANAASTTTPSAAVSTASSSRSTRRMVIAAGVVIAIAIGAAAVFTLTRDQNTTTTTEAGGSVSVSADPASAPSSGASAPTATPKLKQAKDVSAVVAVIPPALARDSSCKKYGFTPEGAVQLWCDVKKGSSILSDLTDRSSQYYLATVDPEAAAKTFTNWDSDNPANFISTGAKTAKARMEASGSGTLTYIDSDTGLTISIQGLRDRAAATAFLQRATLI